MKKLGWIYKTFLALNFVAGFLLLFSLSAVYIEPSKWWLPSLAGLAFLPIFLINLLFFFAWLLFRRKYTLYAACFLIFGFIELPNHLQFNLTEKPVKKEIKILSHNVRNFDLYNWKENKKTRDEILHVIKFKNANIICLQEFFNTTNPKHDFKTLDIILEFKNHYQSHVEYTATVKETEHWGIATFSTFPIVGKGKITFEEKSHNVCIYSDVLIDSDTFRIYNLHLASVRFGHEDYKYLEKVVDRNIDPNVQGSMSLLHKLISGYEKRSAQANKVKEHMDSSPYPVILCGDFNDTPTSYVYNTLVHNLSDSFTKRGNGFGATYNGKVPFLRIDYIFTDPAIKILKHDIVRADISDHYPICASVEIIK